MKQFILPGTATLFLTASVIAACTSNRTLPEGVEVIVPGQHNCQELRSLVSKEPRVLVQGIFGPVSVISRGRCGFKRQAVPASWRANDTFFCTAGFTCRAFFNDDDDDDR